MILSERVSCRMSLLGYLGVGLLAAFAVPAWLVGEEAKNASQQTSAARQEEKKATGSQKGTAVAGQRIMILQSKHAGKAASKQQASGVPVKPAERAKEIGELREKAERIEAFRILPTKTVKDQVLYELCQMPREKRESYLKELRGLSLDGQKMKVHVLIQSALNKINREPTPEARKKAWEEYKKRISDYLAGRAPASDPTAQQPPQAKAGVQLGGGVMVLRQTARDDRKAKVDLPIRADYWLPTPRAAALAQFLAVHAPGVSASADGETLTIRATRDKLDAIRDFIGVVRGPARATSTRRSPKSPEARKGIAIFQLQKPKEPEKKQGKDDDGNK